MANNEYVIKIKWDNTPDGSSVGDAPLGPSAGGDSGSAKADAKPTPGISAASIVSPLMNTGMQMRMNEINTVTGSGQLARKQSLANTAMRSVMDAGMSALSGASVAASLGLAAGPVGAAIGITMSAVSKVLEIATSVQDLANKQRVESASMNATKARASISWDRSRGR